MKTLIINAHPDPHAAEAATNRMVQHLVARLPAGGTEIVNLAEADIQPLQGHAGRDRPYRVSTAATRFRTA